MDSEQFEWQLQEILQLVISDDELLAEALQDASEFSVASIRSFGACGLLTRDHGLVVRMNDGTEFQLTIIQSR